MASVAEVIEIQSLPIVKIYDVPQAGKLVDIAPAGDAFQLADVISFSYYESIYDSFILAKVQFIEASGKIEKAFDGCGIRNFCAVEIELPDPAGDKNIGRKRNKLTFAGTNCFFIKKISKQLVKNKQQLYEIELINRDALVSISQKVLATWPNSESNNIDYNTVIEDLLKNYVKTKKDIGDIMKDKTKPTTKVVGNGQFIYRLIEDACRQGTTLKASGSGKEETGATGYAFFEIYDKYKFPSLYSLVTLDTSESIAYTYKISVVNDSQTTTEEAAYRIISYQFNDENKTSDLLEEVASRKRGKPAWYLLDTNRNVFKKIESLPPEKVIDKCERVPSNEDFVAKEYLNIVEYETEYINTCDPDLEKEPVNKVLSSLNYSALLETLKTKASTFKVPGNLDISAGDKIAISVPVVQGDGAAETEVSAKYSGIYLVTAVKHSLVEMRKVYTHLEAIKIKDE